MMVWQLFHNISFYQTFLSQIVIEMFVLQLQLNFQWIPEVFPNIETINFEQN